MSYIQGPSLLSMGEPEVSEKSLCPRVESPLNVHHKDTEAQRNFDISIRSRPIFSFSVVRKSLPQLRPADLKVPLWFNSNRLDVARQNEIHNKDHKEQS